MEFLERAIYVLLQNEPFFAHFILNSHIAFNRFKVQTAAAAVVDGSPVLIFNTEFMSKLTPHEQVAVLKHEILHLLLEHGSRFQTGSLGKSKHNANIAMDVAINQHIENIPQGGVTLASFKEVIGNKNVLPFETAEYYSSLIQEALQNGSARTSDEIEELQTTDDHDLEVPGQESNSQQAKAAVESAAAKALDQSKGNVSENLSKILNALCTEPKLHWKQLLRNFIASAVSNKTLNTRKKSHRRFDLDFPGKRKKRELVLGVVADSSGSVSDEHYHALVNEINGMINSCSDIYMLHADCEVKKVVHIKSKKDIPMDRHGYGGTAYQPGINKCLELGCNAIVYLGDMDCADTPTNPGIPVLWVTVGSTTRPGEFGKMLELKDQ